MTGDLRDSLSGEIVSSVIVESDVSPFAREDVADRRTNAARSSGYKRALPSSIGPPSNSSPKKPAAKNASGQN